MLRALASYFFGEIENEAPEAPIECETREVNDWLVVNLPDQNMQSINLNDEYYMYEENDDEFNMYEINDEDAIKEMDEDAPSEVDASKMDLDEDDVLLSVSLLMMSETDEPISSEHANNLSILKPGKVINRDAFEEAKYTPFLQYIMAPLSFLTQGQNDVAFLQCVRRYLPSHLIEFSNCMKMDRYQRCVFLEMLRSKTRGKDVVRELDRRFKASLQTAPTRDLSSPPVHSKNYINHRHPEKLLNQDLLQRIKELEPEQQAVQRSVKKNFTRAQFNRQNKNYMFETSSKKNRRCDRQRNHSGANNNRKC